MSSWYFQIDINSWLQFFFSDLIALIKFNYQVISIFPNGFTIIDSSTSKSLAFKNKSMNSVDNKKSLYYKISISKFFYDRTDIKAEVLLLCYIKKITLHHLVKEYLFKYIATHISCSMLIIHNNIIVIKSGPWKGI